MTIKKPPANASDLNVVIRNGFEPLSHWVLAVCATQQLIAASRFVRIGLTRHLPHLIIVRHYHRHSLNACYDDLSLWVLQKPISSHSNHNIEWTLLVYISEMFRKISRSRYRIWKNKIGSCNRPLVQNALPFCGRMRIYPLEVTIFCQNHKCCPRAPFFSGCLTCCYRGYRLVPGVQRSERIFNDKLVSC